MQGTDLILVTGREDLVEDFPSRLVALIDLLGMTDAQFAERIDMHPAHLWRYKTGQHIPSGPILLRMFQLAAQVEGGVDVLIGRNEVWGPSERPRKKPVGRETAPEGAAPSSSIGRDLLRYVYGHRRGR